MDKPRHPLVIQPWKIQQRAKRNVPPVKAGKERGRLDSKGPKMLTSKKIREQGSKKTV